MQRNLQFVTACNLLFIAITAIGCSGGYNNPAKDDVADLRTFEVWANEFAANPHTDVLLPSADDWFAEHFDVELAQRLAAEYRVQANKVDSLPQLFETAKREGKSEVCVSSVSNAIDMNANGLQNAALQRMKKKTTLYTLRMVAPGEEVGNSLWSFVYVDGKFRMAGKMTALKPDGGDLATDLLCQMPLRMSERLLREKGIIDMSAVDYLKNKGVLE